MKVNAKKWNTDPDYVAELIETIGQTQKEVAARIGVSDRAIRHWLSGRSPIPYSAQFCLEVMAKDA